MLRITTVLLFILLYSTTTMAENRIREPYQGIMRCLGGSFNKKECEEDRRHALEVGCISQEELKLIISYEGCPVCNRKNEYLDWCPRG